MNTNAAYDAYLGSRSPTTAYGSTDPNSLRLALGSSTLGTANIVMGFDLSELAALPVDVKITSAVLRMYIGSNPNGGAQSATIQKCDETFDEDECTWQNRDTMPGPLPWSTAGGTVDGTNAVAWSITGTADSWHQSPDITALVQEALDNEDGDVRIHLSTSTSSTSLQNVFASLDSGTPPVLVVEYCAPRARGVAWRTTLSVTEEAEYGVYDATQEPIGVEFSSESLRNQVTFRGREHYVGSGRAARAKHQSDEDPRGQIAGELQPHGFWPLMLKHVLDGDIITGSGVPYTHTLDGKEDPPAGLTFEKKFEFRSGDAISIRYTGCMVNALTIRVPNEGFVTANVDLVGRREQHVDTPMPAATYPPQNDPFTHRNASIAINGFDGDAQPRAVVTSMDLTIENGLQTDIRTIESAGYRRSMVASNRAIRGTLRAFFTAETWEYWNLWRDNTSVSLVLAIASGTWSWQFTLPNLRLEGVPTPRAEGRGPLNLDLAFTAYRDDSTGCDLEVVIVNNDPLISTEVA